VDLLVIDTADAALVGVPGDHRLDALVFSSPGRPWRDVMVAGRWVAQAHHTLGAERAASRFAEVMRRLWEPTQPR
jgi:formimidoylglutamate deiminase